MLAALAISTIFLTGVHRIQGQGIRWGPYPHNHGDNEDYPNYHDNSFESDQDDNSYESDQHDSSYHLFYPVKSYRPDHHGNAYNPNLHGNSYHPNHRGNSHYPSHNDDCGNVVKSIQNELKAHVANAGKFGENIRQILANENKMLTILQPLKDILSRVDQKLVAVETFLKQKLPQIHSEVLSGQRKWPIYVGTLKSEILTGISQNKPPKQINQPSIFQRDYFEDYNNEVIRKINTLTAKIEKLESEMKQIKNENKNFNDINNKCSESLEKFKRQMTDSEFILTQYENKLAEYDKAVSYNPVCNSKELDQWNQSLLEALDNQKSDIKEIFQDVKKVKEKFADLPKKLDFENVRNVTLDKLELLYENHLVPGINVSSLLRPLENTNNNLNENLKNLLKNSNETSVATAMLADKLTQTNEKIEMEIQACGKVEKVMVQIADTVVDTKRKIESKIRDVLAEIGEKMGENSKSMVEATNERFNKFETSIQVHNCGALANVTSKIDDIQQVLRKIDTLYQEMSSNLKNERGACSNVLPDER